MESLTPSDIAVASQSTERNHFQARHSLARFLTFPSSLHEKKNNKKKDKNNLATHTLECSFPLSAALFIAMLWAGTLFLLVLAGWKYFSFSKAVINSEGKKK